MRLFCSTNRQIWSDWGWKSSETTEVFWKKKVIFCTDLEQMFNRTATDLDTLLTTAQHRLPFEFKSTGLQPDGCCCLRNRGNMILFRIGISPPLTTMVRWDGTGQWLGLPGHRTSHKWTSSYATTLTLILLTWRIWWAPNNASKWQIGFNSAFKGIKPWFTRRQLILLQWFCFISHLGQTQFDGPLQRRLSHIYFLNNKSLFWSGLITSRSLSMEFSRTCI